MTLAAQLTSLPRRHWHSPAMSATGEQILHTTPFPISTSALYRCYPSRLTDGPNVICRDGGDAIEEIVTARRVRTSHQRPACAVPMFSQSAVGAKRLVVSPSDRPRIIVSRGRDRRQLLACTPFGLATALTRQSAARVKWPPNSENQELIHDVFSLRIVPSFGEHHVRPWSLSS